MVRTAERDSSAAAKEVNGEISTLTGGDVPFVRWSCGVLLDRSGYVLLVVMDLAHWRTHCSRPRRLPCVNVDWFLALEVVILISTI